MIHPSTPPRLVLPALVLTLVTGSNVWARQHQHDVGTAQELGEVTFLTSCSSDVQTDFDRAVAMLHSFWYQSSEAAFGEIAEKEPSCAMAYWGIAMSRFRQLWERPTPEDLAVGREALKKARQVGPGTQRERDYLAALDEFYSVEAEFMDGKLAYERAMQRVHEQYPSDTEAAVFYALALLGTAYFSPPDGRYVRQRTAGALLEELFMEQPNHPGLAHYIIHSYDYPELAADAVAAARRYAEIAPNAPHALHMPSHIFTRLGLWQESIASNREAAAAARRDGWTGEELHASDYLMYAYLQGAQDAEAERIVEEVSRAVERLRETDPNYFAGLFASAAVPARYAVERREWEGATELDVPHDAFPSGLGCAAEAALLFARGLGAARSGALAEARTSIAELERCRDALSEADQNLWAKRVKVQGTVVSAWVDLMAGQTHEALVLMRSAADLEDRSDKPPATPGSIAPAREQLGEMFLELSRPAEALAAFEETLEEAPRRFRSLYGAARAAALLGDTELARRYFALLVDISREADTERPELREARDFLASAGAGAPKAARDPIELGN